MKSDNNFGSILRDLAESSSLHGIPKIVSSKQRPVKVLWCLLFVATLTVFAIQLYSLFREFYTYPVKTTVSLKFSPLPFPAITFCNMNPVKSSHVDKYPNLKEIIHPRKLKKSQTRNERAIDLSSVSPQTTSSSTTEASASSTSSSVASRTDSKAVNARHHDSISDAAYSSTSPMTYGHSETPDSSAGTSASVGDNLDNTEEVYDTDYWGHYWDDSYEYMDNNDTDYGLLEMGYSTLDPYRQDWYHADHIQYARDSFIDDQMNTQKDKWDERRMNFRAIYKKETLADRVDMGHKLEDMVISASFATSLQNISKFDRITTTEYGNCYTMTSPKYIAMRSGMAHGIKLTLNLEVFEYVKNFASGYGVRAVFHEPGTFPLPAEEGMTLSPGYETSVGLKAIRLTRLGLPYGNCSNGKEFQQKYGIRYSLAVCLHLCRIESTIENCRCIPADAPDFNISSWNVPICSEEDRRCQLEVEVFFDEGTANDKCECISPCRETGYQKTVSGRHWPNGDYLRHVLMTEVCKRNITSMKNACLEINNGSFSHELYEHNFLRLLIYYEDLNYESIIEEPLYEPARFVSDVGGVTGLFLGASVLSLIEILQLLLEVVLFLFRRQKQQDQAQTDVSDEGTQESGLADGSVQLDKNKNRDRVDFLSVFT